MFNIHTILCFSKQIFLSKLVRVIDTFEFWYLLTIIRYNYGLSHITYDINAISSLLFYHSSGGVYLGECSLKLIWTKFSCNSHLYWEHQMLYTLRVRKSDLRQTQMQTSHGKNMFFYRTISTNNNQFQWMI